MIKTRYLALTAIAAGCLAACDDSDVQETVAKAEPRIATEAPKVCFEPASDFDGTISKPGGPFSISYRIIGTPIVGSPVTVALQVTSAAGPRPVMLNYRINDASSMMFPKSQLASVRMESAANENFIKQQVTVIPQREGRSYLNVSASFETEDGTMSTVAAIPIQVGSGGRDLEENGEVQLDENSEAVRVLTPE